MLNKTFDHAEAEPRIYARWEEADCFKPSDDPAAKAYSIVIPPPNVTGSLHMGHAVNNTLQDILCRFERMRGKSVLWQPGTDHAGIATQMVVERQLAERQEPGRREMGREKFLERVWAWKAESGGEITNQLRRLGASCDWSRERFTMDEGLSAAVRKVFVALYKEGLLYRAKRLVNWDPKFLTAISDLEVENVEVQGHLWSLAYPLADGPVGDVEEIVVATTRPETMLGDMAVAVHPDDARYRALIGKEVLLPIVNRRIPIVADEHADPEQGTGAVKITPAHDFNDFDVWKRVCAHDPRHAEQILINVLDIHGAIRDAADAPEEERAALEAIPASLRGLDRFEARDRVVELFDALGLSRGIEDKVIMQPVGDRSGAVIEPYLTDQWYVDAKTLAQPAIEAVEAGRTRFIPENWTKTYYQWMRNIEPWCVSRQLWWGHQIPAWYGPDGKIFVEESESEARAAAEKHYGAPAELTRDEDVLDTWFSSALWPFSTLGWPDETPELARYYPTSALVTGFDIIFFWVARMMMAGLHVMKEVPFRDVYIHALVRDETGAKMSKSKGNVMDPLDLVDGIDLEGLVAKRTKNMLNPAHAKRVAEMTKKTYPQGVKGYGADALRFTLAAMAAQGRDIKLSVDRVEGYRNFGTKLWNAARFCEMNECAYADDFDPASVGETLNRWIVHEAAACAETVTAELEGYRFNEAAGALYRFTWNVFCDWFVELAKPVLQGPDCPAKTEVRAAAAWALDRILVMLHPFMPFLTEELWGETHSRDHLLAQARWPEDMAALKSPGAAEEMTWVIGLVSAIRSVRAEMNVPPSAKIPAHLIGATAASQDRMERHRDLAMRLARLTELSASDAPPKGAVQTVHGEATVALAVADFIDVAAERARLEKEIAKADDEMGRIDKKLSNGNFVAKAPPEVVEEQRARRAEYEAARAKFADGLARLNAL